MDSHVLALVILTILGWGLWGLFAKLGVQTIGKYQYMLVLNIVVLVGIAFYLIFNQKLYITPTKDLVYPFAAGISVIVATIAFFSLVEKTKISWLVAFTSLYPAITIILAALILNEKLTLTQGLGIGLALIAGLLLSL